MTLTYPQPREGVTGTDRTDWLLSLELEAVPHRDALIEAAHTIWDCVLVGNPAPMVRKQYERMNRPRPGDLVVEMSVWWRRRGMDDAQWLDYRTKGFGVLLAHRLERHESDEEWAAELAAENAAGNGWTDDERGTEWAWYVQYGSAAGDICRWTNADFVTLGPFTRDHL